MARYVDTERGLKRVAPIDPFRDVAPFEIRVRWKPEIAAARGPEACYEGVVLVLRSAEAVRLYSRNGLIALLYACEIERIT